MKYDLHSHSNVSDGKLSPSALLQRAKEKQVDVLSITDHDTIAAYENLTKEDLKGIQLVTGIEFSSRWRNNNIHIVGLDIDVNDTKLKDFINQHHQVRIERAGRILKKLSKILKTEISIEEITENTETHNIGRPHIANYLLRHKWVKDEKEAFNKYLGTGKSCDVKTHWLDIEKIVGTILTSGGIAVLAHPLKYKFTRTKLLELLEDFKQVGGQAMEVISGQQNPQQTKEMNKLAEYKDLYTSCGSDFHSPEQGRSELGQFANLPDKSTAVWKIF